jgi:DME family drug/metabolite transporter
VTVLMRSRRGGRTAGRTAGRQHPGATALAGFAVGAVCLLPLALAEGILPDRAAPAPLAGTAAWLVYLGAVPTALAYALFFAGLAGIRATTASVVALLEVVTAAVAAVVLLGERLTAPAVLGTAVLLVAVAALARDETRTAAG